ncbi:HNH endonuclease signature motif containing protein [Loktanella salsilacus]|uniref:HNH endonuclease signature motif containing protein n=1 Tax=Loktanella salsilacus TaxID=195913 RepID=UPI0020B8EADD|nr:HNH endonuclease signature motif containing protein [Loktanella salsilacus]UTH45302.1 HNH endonuclease [Loktanella salsilacus]
MPSSKTPVGAHDHLLEIYETEVEVEYRGERYCVRDNGAVYRLNESRKRARPLDKTWTFGRQNLTTGYHLLAGVPIHRIVCSAFNGLPPSNQHVVDHIDTNRANNRPENLRWLTRLENALLNEITARRIELAYGSIEAFLEDPSRPIDETSFPDVSWMRTVTKEEGSITKHRFEGWAKSGFVPSGGAIGEWLYGTRERADFEPEPLEYESLTPSAIQVKWKVPTEFPGCPEAMSEDGLERYAQNLRFGEVFARNDIYQSLVVQSALVEDGLIVLTRAAEADAIKNWAVATITIGGELFVHRSEHQYFTLQGALKTFCELTGENLVDSIDDYT